MNEIAAVLKDHTLNGTSFIINSDWDILKTKTFANLLNTMRTYRCSRWRDICGCIHLTIHKLHHLHQLSIQL